MNRPRAAPWARTAFAAALAVHLLLVASLPTGWLDPLFNDCTHRGAPGSDFHVVWKAGRNLWRGESPYRIDAREDPPSWGDYRYLPLSALTISVVAAAFPPRTARIGWIVINELLLAAAVLATLRLAPDRSTGRLAAALWLAFTPYYVELFIGQLDFFLAVGFLGVAAALLGRGGRLGPAAWLTATTFKWAGAALLPLLLERRRFKAPALWAATSLGTAALWFAARPEDWARFRSTILRGGFATPHAGNYGLQALVSSTMTFLSPGVFGDLSRWAEHGRLVLSYVLAERILLFAAGGLALAATFLGKRRLTVGEGVALWTSLLAVGWNEFWEHQYVLLLPGLVLLVIEGRRRLALSVWVPLALPTLFALFDRPHAEVVAAMPAGYDNPDLFILLSPLQNLALHLTKAVPALVLFLAVACSAWRAPAGGEESV